MESPHLFNIYVGDLRSRLEKLHPRLCKFLHLTIAIILYADDAALPADIADDLALSTEIFVEFCNETRLFIAVPKTMFMVCHASDAHGVTYKNGKVHVDGDEVKIFIYGEQVQATGSFKYLWVHMATGGSTHISTEPNRRAATIFRSCELTFIRTSLRNLFVENFS